MLRFSGIHVCIWIGAVFLVACGGNVTLDNAGKEARAVTLGNDRFVVRAGETQVIDLKAGRYKIEVTDLKGDVLQDTLVEINAGGLINLGGAEYLLWRDVFSPKATLEMRKQLLKIRPLQIGDQVFEIEYEEIPSDLLFVEKTWDYSLDEDFPKRVYGWQLDKDKQYMFKSKLVRKSDFVSTYLKSAQP